MTMMFFADDDDVFADDDDVFADEDDKTGS
jgi:hypothetical protein